MEGEQITATSMDANNQAHQNIVSVTSVQQEDRVGCVRGSIDKDTMATWNDRHSYRASDREQNMKHSLPSNDKQAELKAWSNRSRRAIASLIYHDAHMPYR